MPAFLRAFIAVEVSPRPALRKVLEELSNFGAAVRPVAAGDLHITVKFLGDIPVESVSPLDAALRGVVGDHASSRHGLQGLGVFPHLQRPSVVWAGVTAPEPLVELARQVDACCAGLEFPVEQRSFHPHLTLARVKARPPETLAGFVQAGASRSFGSLDVRRLTLFQSDLQRSGPRYTALAHWPLKSFDHDVR